MHTDWGAAWLAMADDAFPADAAQDQAAAVDAALPDPPLWGLVIDNEEEFLAAHGPEALEDARLDLRDMGSW